MIRITFVLTWFVITIFISIVADADTVWETDQVLGQNGIYDFAGIYEFENLTINDKVQIFSTNISQLVLKVNGKLKLGKNAVIRVRNDFYPQGSENLINQLTINNLFTYGFLWNGFQLFPNIFGEYGYGDAGTYGGGILSIIANTIEYDETSPPKFLVSGQKGEYSWKSGEGGILIIESTNYIQSTEHYNLDYTDYGEEIVPETNGGHGIVTGNPQKVFIYKQRIYGTVIDLETEEPISNVKVSCSVCDNAFSDAQGHYTLYPYQAGKYEIQFNASGYQELHIPEISVQELGHKLLDIKMTVPGLVAFVTEKLPVTEITKPLHARIRIQGGHLPYIFQIIKGELPSGLSLNSETGEITGVCQVPGEYDFTIQVEDSVSKIERSFSIEVSEILELLSPLVLPRATKDVNYSYQIEASGGFPPYFFSYASIERPPGLNISTKGIIGGHNNRIYFSESFDNNSVPEIFLMSGQRDPFITENHRLKFGDISDSNNSQIKLNFDVPETVIIQFDYQVSSEKDYDKLEFMIDNQNIHSWSGSDSGKYSYELTHGSYVIAWRYSKDVSTSYNQDTAWIDNISILPANNDGGSIPTESGQYTFNISVTDDRNQFTEKQFFLEVVEPVKILTSKINNAVVGINYTQNFEVSGGHGNYQAKITPQNLPAGLIFDPKTMTLSGIASESASLTIALEVADAENRIHKKIFNLFVLKPLQITHSKLPNGFVQMNYSQYINIEGGNAPYSFTCNDVLPPGLDLITNNGRIWGTPSTAGLMHFNITVTDSTYPISQSFTKQIAMRTLITYPVEQSLQKTYFSHQLFSDYSMSQCIISGGSLPEGLTLNSNTGVISGIPLECGNFFFSVDAYTENYTDYYAYSLNVECCENCYEISGNISQESDVIVSLNGETTYTTTTDKNGYYRFDQIANGQYTMAAKKDNYWIEPLLQDIKINNLDKTDIDFTAVPNNAPLTPIAQIPANNSYEIGLTTTQLQWSCNDIDKLDVLEYDIYFGNTHNLELLASGVSETSVNLNSQLNHATTYFWRISARDSFGAETKGPLWHFDTINSGEKYLKILTHNLPVSEIDKFYSEKIMVNGGAYPYTFTIQSGELPPNVVLHENYGFISGQLTKTGTYYFTIKVTGSDIDKPGNIAEKEFYIEVTHDLKFITQNQLPRATLGQKYECSFDAVGGREPYVFQYHPKHEKNYELNKSLKNWNEAKESCEINNGYLVTIDSSEEFYKVKSIAKNGSRDTWIGLFRQDSSSEWQWVANEPVDFTYWYDINTYDNKNCAYLRKYQDYKWYNQRCEDDEYYICEYGVIKGLTLEPEGTIKGTPENYTTYSVTVIVTDASGRQAEKDFFLPVDEVLEISELSIHQGRFNDGIVGVDYHQDLNAKGGYGSYYWDIYYGKLPEGLELDSETGIISGRPENVAYRSVVIIVTDDAERKTYKDLIFEISEPLYFQTTSLSDAFRDQPYSEKIELNPQSGISPYVFSLEGDLPNGLNLDPLTGRIDGTPTTSGLFNFDIIVTDSTFPDQQVVRQFFQLKSTTEFTIFAASTLQNNKNDIISIDLGVGGGQPPYSWSIIRGYLPGGVYLEPIASLKGKLEDRGDYQFTLQVIDSSGNTREKDFTWNVLDDLVITTQIIPDGDTQTNYEYQLIAKGGLKPYTWRVLSGDLPEGMAFLETGLIYGKPKGAQPRQFTVEVSDSSLPQKKRITKDYRIEIMDDFYITTMKIDNGKCDTPYSDSIMATLGSPPYHWKLDSGYLPPGLNIHEGVNDALIEGSPTTEGIYTFIIESTDSGTPINKDTKEFKIEIYAGLSILTKKLKTAQRGIFYSDNITPLGGELPYHYEITDGSLPAGLSLNKLTGKISGKTNIDTGYSISFKIKATDSGVPSSSIEKEFSINVTDPVSIETTNIQNAFQKSPYIAQIEGKGGYSPYYWRISNGQLPDGLKLIPNTAQINGTPMTCGNFDFTVQLVDASQVPITVTHAYQLNVKCCNNYNLSGLVHDMEGVVITISDDNHFYSTTTNEAGIYTFFNLQNSDYLVKIFEQRCWANEPKIQEVTIYNQDISGIDFSARWNLPPLMASNPKPLSFAVDISLNPTLSWTGEDQDEKDSLTYDLYFGTEDRPELFKSDLSESSTNLNLLSANTKYFWQIVTKDSKSGITSGPIWSFTTLNHIPQKPSNPFPINNAEQVGLYVDLSWACEDLDLEDLLIYDVMLGTSSDHLSTIVQTTDNNVSVTLNANTRYFWQVLAHDNHEGTQVGPVWSFMTLNRHPEISDTIFPPDNQQNTQLDIQLSWKAIDPDPDDTLKYDVYFGTTSSPSVQSVNLSQSNFNPGPLMPNTKYHWKILVKDSHGAEIFSPVYHFTTKNRNPYVPSKPYPENETTRIDLNSHLSWTGGDPDINDKVVYKIYFGKTLADMALLVVGQSMTDFYPENLQTNTTYFWQIISRDSHSAESQGPVWQFKTISPGQLSFELKKIEIFENQGSVQINIIRNNGTEGEISVDYHTSPENAVPSVDYKPASGTLVFAEGDQIKSFTIQIYDDYLFENNETINLFLSNPTAHASLGYLNKAVLTILNDQTDLKAGDIDGNNNVNLGDAILMMKILSEFSVEISEKHADVNGNERLGFEELMYILNYIMQ